MYILHHASVIVNELEMLIFKNKFIKCFIFFILLDSPGHILTLFSIFC